MPSPAPRPVSYDVVIDIRHPDPVAVGEWGLFVLRPSIATLVPEPFLSSSSPRSLEMKSTPLNWGSPVAWIPAPRLFKV
jgi:hypothetical protein